MKNIIIYLILILVNVLQLNAQPFTYSGYVYGANNQGLLDIPVSLYGKRIDPYEVTFPTYNTSLEFNVGTPVASSDDATHGPFNIGFTFNFFGNNYTQFYIGSNGWIGFSSGQTTGYTAAYIPNSSSPKNVIMADWEDLYPGASNIYYKTIGTSPNRKLVVNFYNVPHYTCRTNKTTFQIVLSETTSVIDINYSSKPLCTTNNATAGLVNVDNTNVVPVGGKNASLWTVTNYSVRITPSVPELTFSLKGVYLTNSVGYYSISPNLDAQSYLFEVRLENLSISGLSNAEAKYPIQMIFNNTPMNSKLYYQMDINNDGRITVSDSYNLFGKISGIFQNWGFSPSYRIFTSSQWSIINIGTNNLKITYPGSQSITITPINGGTTNFYVVRTGFTN
jgi:hypothetical protein